MSTALDLQGHRHAQRVAYEAACEVAAGLEPGITEAEAAFRLGAALAARGVRRYFHVPFAWFGRRSAFEGLSGFSPAFRPGRTRLERGMAGILDVGPVVGGYVADIGYSFVCGGGDERFERAMATLREVRALIPARVDEGATMRGICVEVDRLLRSRGYDNLHVRYPFGVLGHRVFRTHVPLPDPALGGFGLREATKLLGRELVARIPGFVARSPLWRDTDGAERRVEPGVWALEPHLGAGDFGAKFEELLVIEPSGRARWLSDDLPHVGPREAASERPRPAPPAAG